MASPSSGRTVLLPDSLHREERLSHPLDQAPSPPPHHPRTPHTGASQALHSRRDPVSPGPRRRLHRHLSTSGRHSDLRSTQETTSWGYKTTLPSRTQPQGPEQAPETLPLEFPQPFGRRSHPASFPRRNDLRRGRRGSIPPRRGSSRISRSPGILFRGNNLRLERHALWPEPQRPRLDHDRRRRHAFRSGAAAGRRRTLSGPSRPSARSVSKLRRRRVRDRRSGRSRRSPSAVRHPRHYSLRQEGSTTQPHHRVARLPRDVPPKQPRSARHHLQARSQHTSSVSQLHPQLQQQDHRHQAVSRTSTWQARKPRHSRTSHPSHLTSFARRHEGSNEDVMGRSRFSHLRHGKRHRGMADRFQRRQSGRTRPESPSRHPHHRRRFVRWMGGNTGHPIRGPSVVNGRELLQHGVPLAHHSTRDSRRSASRRALEDSPPRSHSSLAVRRNHRRSLAETKDNPLQGRRSSSGRPPRKALGSSQHPRDSYSPGWNLEPGSGRSLPTGVLASRPSRLHNPQRGSVFVAAPSQGPSSRSPLRGSFRVGRQSQVPAVQRPPVGQPSDHGRNGVSSRSLDRTSQLHVPAQQPARLGPTHGSSQGLSRHPRSSDRAPLASGDLVDNSAPAARAQARWTTPQGIIPMWSVWFPRASQWSIDNVGLHRMRPPSMPDLTGANRVITYPLAEFDRAPSTWKVYDAGLRRFLSTMAEIEPMLPFMTLPLPFSLIHSASQVLGSHSSSILSNGLSAWSMTHARLRLPPPLSTTNSKLLWRDVRVSEQRNRQGIRKEAPPIPVGVMKHALIRSTRAMTSGVALLTNRDYLIRNHLLSFLGYVAFLRQADAGNVHVILKDGPPNLLHLFIPAPNKTGGRVIEVWSSSSSHKLFNPVAWSNLWRSTKIFKAASLKSPFVLVHGLDSSPTDRNPPRAVPLFPITVGPSIGIPIKAVTVGRIWLSWLESYGSTMSDHRRHFTSHSWRRGGVTAAKEAGIHSADLHATGGWNDPAGSTMTRVYLGRVTASVSHQIFPSSPTDDLPAPPAPHSAAPSRPRPSAATSPPSRVSSPPTSRAEDPLSFLPAPLSPDRTRRPVSAASSKTARRPITAPAGSSRAQSTSNPFLYSTSRGNKDAPRGGLRSARRR